MGRDAFSGGSRLMISNRHYAAALDALDFFTDEDKSPEDNLIDCLSDVMLESIERNDQHLVFVVADDGSDDEFDWGLLLRLTPYLEEGSFYEEYPPEMEDETGRSYQCVFVGTVENGHLIRRCYEIVENSQGEKTRRLVEVFDRDLENN